MKTASDPEVAPYSPPPLAPAPAAGSPAPVTPAEVAGPVRGGISVGSILTGALVVGAAVVLFALIARASATYAGYHPRILPIGGVRGTGFWVALGTGAGLFLAFAWGGYTAGRMGRGRGWLNGLLVVLAVGVLSAIGAGMASLLRPGPGLDLAFRLPAGYPKTHFLFSQAAAASTGVLLALAGALVGGMLGSRWHRALERRVAKRQVEAKEARESFSDLREALTAPLEPGPLSSAYRPDHAYDQEAGATA
ncbi:MAG TPA: hypothetical protein VFW71_03110 [Actinomycetota bacterium]|nr:hypothetical protein [Actinomycetota bacterium]